MHVTAACTRAARRPGLRVRELEREVQERGGRLDLLKAAAGLQEGREGGAHSLLL